MFNAATYEIAWNPDAAVRRVVDFCLRLSCVAGLIGIIVAEIYYGNLILLRQKKGSPGKVRAERGSIMLNHKIIIL